MIYVLYGTENVLIKDFINNIKIREKVDNIINYNLEDVSMNEILEDASYNSLFCDKKVIVVNNSYFLTSENINTDLLEKYINNINEYTFLIFVLYEESIDNRKKVVKLLKDKAVVKEFNVLSNYKLESLVEDNFKLDNKQIEKKALYELINRCKSDYSLISTECEKLKLYKLNEELITYEDVIKVVSKNIEDDIFKLTDAIGEKDKVKIMKIYKDLIDNGNDPIYILGAIGSQFRIYKQVRDLVKNNYTNKEIENILKIHPYRVKLAREKLNYFSEEFVNNLLINLYELDLEFKSKNTNNYVSLELFLLSM